METTILTPHALRTRILAAPARPEDCQPGTGAGDVYVRFVRAQTVKQEHDAAINRMRTRISLAHQRLSEADVDSDFAALAGERLAIDLLGKRVETMREEHERGINQEIQNARMGMTAASDAITTVRNRLLRRVAEGSDEFLAPWLESEGNDLLADYEELVGPLPLIIDEPIAA